MSTSTAERFIELLHNDRHAKLALLACSAALQLDDETAREAVDLVVRTNGSSYALVRRVKELGCVWKEWNGFWHVSEDVRRGLFDRLHRELPESTIVKLRQLLAEKAESRAAQINSHDHVSTHEKMLARFEAAYHRVLIRGQSETGANALGKLWRELPSSVGDTLALSVDYLADELKQRLGRLPDEIVFLRGIAARERGDDHAQEKHFGRVWKRGRRGQHGYIHAIAAYSLGLLIQQRDPKTAEKALRDSLDWMETDPERDRVYHAIEKLLNFDYSFEPHIQVPENWAEAAVTVEDSKAAIHDQAYQFVVNYFRQASGPEINTRRLADELYGRFFEPHQGVWQNGAEFFDFVSRLIKRIVLSSARTQYLTKIDNDLPSRDVNDVDDFGTRPDADLLALEHALSLLEEYDPDQVRIVELRFYAGLSLERIADVMQLSTADVEREWRLAKAFLKRELTRGNDVLRVLNLASSMTTANFSVDSRPANP